MFGSEVTLPVPLLPQAILFAAMGGLSAVLANRGVAIFHDGLRPILPSYRDGNVDAKSIRRTSFTLGLGFLWAFGLPFSLGYAIPMVYLIFIATDYIGVAMRTTHHEAWYKSRRGLFGVLSSFVLGAAWSAAVAVFLRVASDLMAAAPIEMARTVQLITQPALDAFFLFAVLTVFYHYGLKQGLFSAIVSTAVWAAAATLGMPYPPAWAFGAGLVYLVVLVVCESRRPGNEFGDVPAEWLTDQAGSSSVKNAPDEDDFFRKNTGRIKRNLPLIIVIHALAGAAYNLGYMASDPISAALYLHGLAVPAALAAAAWFLAFVPMKYTTAVMTGVWILTGTSLEPSIAMLMPNPWIAAAAVAVFRIIEVLSLLWFFKNLDRFTVIREIADTMRTAIFQVMEIAFLVGGAMAAAAFAGGWGVAAVIAAWFINQRSNAPVMPMSLGAVTAIGVGIIANLLALAGVHL